MKKQLLSLLLMVCTIAISQELDDVKNPLEEALQVFPVSPEAASLGKYGDVPVNLATGKINYTVPIYTIQHGGFEWPIMLSYNYGGLIAEQDHPMTGIGWDLIANGRITRQIRGLDDDYGNQSFKNTLFVPYLRGDFNHLNPDQLGEKTFNVYDKIANQNHDAEQDKYAINVPGLEGSFVFNEVGEVVFLNYKNYKVQKNGDVFTIVNDKGVTYHFNIHELGTHTYTANNEPVENTVPISYLLTKIVLPNHKGAIDFVYGAEEFYSKRVYSESMSLGYLVPTVIKRSSSNNTSTRRTLQKIVFPNGEVRFNITNSVDQSVATQALNSVSVWNSSKQIIKYDFTYNDPTKNRKVLTSITKSNKGVALPWYQFEYHAAPNLVAPDQNYKQQDFWGYYNGSLRPLLPAENREIDPNKTISGALKKITYPTKGYSEIVYEQNRIAIGSSSTASNCSYSHNKSFSKTISIENGVFDKVLDTIIQVPEQQVVTVNGNITLGEGTNYTFWGAESDITISSVGGGCRYQNINLRMKKHGETIPCEPGTSNDCPDTYTETNTQTGFTQDGKIRVQVRLTAPFNSSAKFRFSIRYEERGEDTPYKLIGGIRVSQTKDCDGDGNCKTKTYKYIKEDGTDSGVLVGSPAVFEYQTTVAKHLRVTTTTHRVAKSMQDVNSYAGSPVLYPRVEIWEEDGTNGKTVNHYSSFGNSGGSYPFVPPVNNDWLKGKLLKSEVFAKRGQNFVLQKETVNEYQTVYPFGQFGLSTVKAYGMAVGRIMYRYGEDGHFNGLIDGNPTHYQSNFYVDYPKEYKLVKTIDKEFLHGQTLTSETSYTYDNPYGQLKTQTNTDSHNNTIVTQFFYPYDLSNTVHNSLIDQNRITTPIETQTKQGDEFVASQTTEFKDWGDGKLLPKMVKTLKGEKSTVNIFQDQVEYLSYDNQGYPLEVLQVDGRHIMYVWGYNNTLPIAKIDNASYVGISSTASSLITQLQTASNTEDTPAEEVTMRNLFKDLREDVYFADAQLTGYTYDPLIGVTSMTDPKGYTTYYRYDEFNRLQYGLDQNQHVAQQVRYNYQGEQTATLGDVTITPSLSTVQPNQSVTFTSNTSGSGSADMYTWSVGGTQAQCDGSTSFTKSFSAEGTYAVSVIAYNTQTKHRVSKTMNVVVAYPPISVPAVSTNYTYVVKGTNVDFSASNVGGGTGNLRYEWYVNNAKQASTATTLRYNPGTAGTYNVYFKVIDNTSGKTKISNTRTLYAYNPLNTPTVSASKAHIVRGTTTTFTASGIGGGSGNRRYEWYVNNVKQSATGTTYSYHFPTAGTYTIKFKVVDLTMQNANYKWGANAPVLKVYPGMTASSSQSHTSISGTHPSVSFSITSVAGGSGSRQISWKAYKSTNLSHALGSGSGTNFGFSNFSNGTHEYTIKATITDNLTGQQITKTMIVVATVSSDNGDGDCPDCGDQH
ncbi:hypothetical protein ATO12_19355 [Aquimarina atlantica]|uniref:PKD domain-containing protein n=1 Tax=Aquimarina atlantica TaxID=1317122 RepID=A0A023BT63_9FLAO|nr:PKD domain-containing protein [Aquimarina atlantica]EZH73165.1 hypothetical protein ATO12_19355 [Aquimarina atlantica]